LDSNESAQPASASSTDASYFTTELLAAGQISALIESIKTASVQTTDAYSPLIRFGVFAVATAHFGKWHVYGA
jgi:hypothetical protein